ncbi:GvpL/GvpF family gas vesicle protein [Pectobacteriaceae bacterium CE90]|nr:GvpL/GvpF family gas vesicle protein [Prodigiosinella sp. LS101]WJV54113.1 GvpL/GvpF family gas vesicle protein [Prodigiosinella sp. LS101]WJV58476.1 GvpL/GvpF family gas vesicle protein [Pectobacteriaceae bacterium C111]WJY14874.1 GvpL/GvpF family gas vesicle protein [Pectobacteriaceae bacterium CE90]
MTMNTEVQTEQAIYLYGLTLPDLAAPPILGVDNQHPINIHQCAGLNAVISPVALSDFTGEKGEDNVQNVTWLTPRICRHAQIIDSLMAQGPVYPLPFGTLFSSQNALEQEMKNRATDVFVLLRHITGCQEWALEATLDRKQAVDVLFTEGLDSGRFCLPEAIGRRHLEEQKLRRRLTTELSDWLAHALTAMQNELHPLVRDFRSRRLLDDKILHWAYLLPVEDVAAFQQQVADIVERYEAYGFSFRVTGPWAAYSFCQPDES